MLSFPSSKVEFFSHSLLDSPKNPWGPQFVYQGFKVAHGNYRIYLKVIIQSHLGYFGDIVFSDLECSS
jgi:hypothetical protein